MIAQRARPASAPSAATGADGFQGSQACRRFGAQATGLMERQLKAISKNGIAEALAKVQHYRYLNQAEEAESICRDILAIDPENQMALRQLGLALTDQFRGTLSDGFHEAQTCFEKLF